MTAPAAVQWTFDEVGGRLLLDLAAIALLAIGLFYRRHRRRDLVVLYVMFNVGLFAAVIVISEGGIAAAVSFGLFAVLSIIRLRAEQLSSQEIAHFFAAIVLGLVTAVDLGSLPATAGLAALVLAAPAIIDHPGVLSGNHRLVIVVERAEADRQAVLAEVERRVGMPVISMEVLEVDYVRETTRVEIRILETGRAPARR